jgi:hypothetical protein
MKYKINGIPNGPSCQNEAGVCPYWSETKNKIKCEYCNVKISKEETDDQLFNLKKICGVNV